MFKVPSIAIVLIILYGMCITTMSVFAPDMVFPSMLKPIVEGLTVKTRYIICILAWLAHFLEGVLVFYLSRKVSDTWPESILWFLQTCLVGYPSTSIKLKHYRDLRKASQQRKK